MIKEFLNKPKEFFDKLNRRRAREITMDPIARDREATINNLLAQLDLSHRDRKSATPGEEQLREALANEEWERAANILETKQDRTPEDENDFGVALAHVAEEAAVWAEAIDALRRCIAESSPVQARAEENLKVVEQARRVADS